MTVFAGMHELLRAEHVELNACADVMKLYDDARGQIDLYVPRHVAAHVTAAFNRAMQAAPNGDGWTYTTKSGAWHITCPMPLVYLGQHEKATGDGDPGYLFAQSDSLIVCMDVIDDIEAEEACTECHSLVGTGNLHQVYADRHFCADCLAAENEHQQGLSEMADDDLAHAMMERAAE